MTDPCEFYSYAFDADLLGRHGCPNCEGEGLDNNFNEQHNNQDQENNDVA